MKAQWFEAKRTFSPAELVLVINGRVVDFAKVASTLPHRHGRSWAEYRGDLEKRGYVIEELPEVEL